MSFAPGHNRDSVHFAVQHPAGSLRSITKKIEPLAYEICHPAVVFPVEVIRSHKLPALQHFSQLFGCLATRAPIAEYTGKVRCH